MRFNNLSIGELFHSGISQGSGIKSNTTFYCVYQKVNNSSAICVKQVNYDNERSVGHVFRFSGMQRVWRIEDDPKVSLL